MLAIVHHSIQEPEPQLTIKGALTGSRNRVTRRGKFFFNIMARTHGRLARTHLSSGDRRLSCCIQGTRLVPIVSPAHFPFPFSPVLLTTPLRRHLPDLRKNLEHVDFHGRRDALQVIKKLVKLDLSHRLILPKRVFVEVWYVGLWEARGKEVAGAEDGN